MRSYRPSIQVLMVLVLLFLAGCNYPGAPVTEAVRYITWTPKPTDTVLPTDTPAPTATFTLAPSPTFTVEPPTPEAAAPTQPHSDATIPPEMAIRVYYINEKEGGMFGCNEALWYLNTKQAKTGDIATDVRYALSVMLAYHQPKIGILRHGGYASKLAVGNVEVRTNDGGVIVSLTGEYIAGDDRCDGKRFIDQMRQTIKSLGAPGYIQILVNGTPIADVVARK